MAEVGITPPIGTTLMVGGLALYNGHPIGIVHSICDDGTVVVRLNQGPVPEAVNPWLPTTFLKYPIQSLDNPAKSRFDRILEDL
jgi:hypothetical protein